MKFYNLEDVPVLRGDRVFKVSPIREAIACVIVYAGSATALYFGIWGGKDHHDLCFLAAIIALVGLLPVGLLRASLRPTNWLLRCNDEAMIVKYRAFENWRLPANGPQAFELKYSEVASAKIIKETRSEPELGRGGTTTSYVTYLALSLVNPDTAALEDHLQRERSIQPDGKTITSITMDYPVQTAPDGVVEIRWSGGISPSAHQAIEFLGSRIQILDKESRKTNLTHRRDATPEEEQQKIILLVKSGDTMAAAKLAQQAYGYSLSDAMNYVDKLEGAEE